MVFNPVTDFLGLWRNSGGNVSKLEMPGLDYVVAALARAGVVNLVTSGTAPVTSQSTTAWLQPAVPSYSAEGVLNLWNPAASAYAVATPGLFLQFLEASAGESGISYFTVTGAPSNAVGRNGDLAIRLDNPGGVYGPKAAGAWPLTPLPGTSAVITSTELDNSFGAVQGQMIYRGASVWQALAVGSPQSVIASVGSVPAWETVSVLLDAVFGSAQGDILYRDAGAWMALAAGVAGQVLSTGGAGANPSWTAKTPEFSSGTVMLFQQTSAPTGWTKQTTFNDYGLRVTSGAVGVTAGTAFSTVFAQTATGGHALSIAEMPAHNHPILPTGALGGAGQTTFAGGGTNAPQSAEALSTDFTGAGGAHSHSVNLTLAYVDVIIAQKN